MDGSRTPARGTARTIAIVAATIAVSLVSSGPASAATPYCESVTETSNQDWMRALPDDTSLAAVSMPGTHQTLSLHGGDLTQTQENHGDSAETLTAQLDAGIRGIDIRVRRYDNLFTLHHGPFYQNANFADVLAKAGAFLEAHPGETVVMRLKAECTGELTSCSDENSDMEPTEIFDWYRDNDPNGHYLHVPTEMPTLGEVRGKIVLATMQDAQGGLYDGYGLTQFNNDTWGDYVQDEYDVPSVGDIDDKWNAVLAHLDKTAGADSNELYLNFSSGSSIAAVPKTVACGQSDVRGVNDYALEHLSGTDDRTGLVMMDYPGADLIEALIARNG